MENKLNEMNFVVKKGRGKVAVIHIDRMRKLPNELGSENSDSQEDDMHSTSQPKLRHKPSDAAMETSTHCTMTTNCTDSNSNTPLFSSMDTCSDHSPNACVSIGLDICNPAVAESQSTHGSSTTIAESATAKHRPRLAVTGRVTRVRRRPARFLETVCARWLPDRRKAANTRCRSTSSDVSAASCRQLGVSKCCVHVAESSIRVVRSCLLPSSNLMLRCVDDMSDRSIRDFDMEREPSDSENSDAGSWVSDAPGPDAGLPALAFEAPAAWPADTAEGG